MKNIKFNYLSKKLESQSWYKTFGKKMKWSKKLLPIILFSFLGACQKTSSNTSIRSITVQIGNVPPFILKNPTVTKNSCGGHDIAYVDSTTSPTYRSFTFVNMPDTASGEFQITQSGYCPIGGFTLDLDPVIQTQIGGLSWVSSFGQTPAALVKTGSNSFKLTGWVGYPNFVLTPSASYVQIIGNYPITVIGNY